MSDHTHEIRSLERCIARCTDDRVRWLLEDRVANLRAQTLQEASRQEIPEPEQPAVIDQSIWPCSHCQAADINDAETRCVDGANCSAQQEIEKE